MWEGEPHVNLALLNKVYIGTPHIAGYSADGKVNADNMVIEGLCRHFGLENRWHIEPPAIDIELSATDTTDDQYLRYYNPLTDSQKLKNAPEKFEELRGNYPHSARNSTKNRDFLHKTHVGVQVKVLFL